jgi:hypothetical protein
MQRIKSRVVLSIAVLVAPLLAGSMVESSAAAQESCDFSSDLYAASNAQLQACGLTEVPLSGTTALPGGGLSYNYTLPDGQTYSMDASPSGFDPSTASAAEDAAYGVPPAPPTWSPGYKTGQAVANGSWAPAAKEPYLVVSDAPVTEPTTSSGASVPVVPSANWAGYTQAGSGWTENESEYIEPTLGVTRCPNPAVSFWAGIGNQADALGQDGTDSGAGSPGLHEVFFENLPANAAFPGVTAPAGSGVVATVLYDGSDRWSYDIEVGGTNHPYSGTGGYDGSVVEDIAERPKVNGRFAPLLNFESINMQGYTGRTGQVLAPTKEWDMSGYATTGPISNGDFTVTQTSCSG